MSSFTPEVGKIYVLHPVILPHYHHIIFARCESFTKSGRPRMRVFQTHSEKVTTGSRFCEYILSIKKNKEGEYVTLADIDKIRYAVVARMCRDDGRWRIYLSRTTSQTPGYYIGEEYDVDKVYIYTLHT